MSNPDQLLNLLREKTRQINLSFNEDLWDLFEKSINQWQEERNKGQNLMSKYQGFPGSKKYKEGKRLNDLAQAKLEKLHSDAVYLRKRKNEITGKRKP